METYITVFFNKENIITTNAKLQKPTTNAKDEIATSDVREDNASNLN